MTLWVLNHYAGTPDQQATRAFDLGRQLVRRGHAVTVFASSYSHYRHREERLQPGEAWRLDTVDGVGFLWLRTFPYRRNDWRRVVNILGYSWRAYRAGRRLQPAPDAIVGTCMHPLAPLVAYLLARRHRARFYYEVTDLWPQTLVDMGALGPRHPFVWLLRRLERFLFVRAAGIITLLPFAREYVASLGLPSEKVTWVPNGVDVEAYDRPPQPAPRQGGFVLMYLGGFSEYHALDTVLDAMAIIEAGRDDIEVRLIGSGVEKARLEEKARALGLRHVTFEPPVPKVEVAARLREADALIYSFRDLPLLRFGVSPVKIFDYLLAGRPVIYAVNGRNDPVAEASAGLTVRPEDPHAMADAILRLVVMTPAERERMGENGRAYVIANHDTRRLAERLEHAVGGATGA